MWNAVSDKDANDSDFSKYLFHYDYAALQTGFVQPYADSPMDNEQVGEEVYISMINKAEKYCWFMTPYLIITNILLNYILYAFLFFSFYHKLTINHRFFDIFSFTPL